MRTHLCSDAALHLVILFFNKQYHFYKSVGGSFHMLSSAPFPNMFDEAEAEQ